MPSADQPFHASNQSCQKHTSTNDVEQLRAEATGREEITRARTRAHGREVNAEMVELAELLDVEQLQAVAGDVEQLQAVAGDVEQLQAVAGDVEQLQAVAGDVEQLQAERKPWKSKLTSNERQEAKF